MLEELKDLGEKGIFTAVCPNRIDAFQALKILTDRNQGYYEEENGI